MESIDKELKQDIVKAFKVLFDTEVTADSLLLQPTRKEFEGTHTLVVFSYIKLTRKSPEESGRLIGEYLQAHSDVVSGYNVVKGFLNLSIADVV